MVLVASVSGGKKIIGSRFAFRKNTDAPLNP